MAIEGPVRELPLSDLLQLLFLSRRTGRLVVRSELSEQTVTLELENGSLTGATATSPETRLGRLLVGSGRATEGQIEDALAVQLSAPGRRLGEILVDRGAVREAEIRRHLRLQVEEAVFDVMRWEAGHLKFDEGEPRPAGVIEVKLPTDIVLMDAVRRLDEWAEVTADASEPDPLPRLAIGANRSGPPLSLQPFEWEVLTKIDGEQSLKQIARGLGRGELEVARAIYRLTSVGVVEIGGVADEPEIDLDPVDVEVKEIESALAAGDLGSASRRLRSLASLRPKSSAFHVLEGRVLHGEGDSGGALRAFERAIEVDPLMAKAYFHFARAACQVGDLKGALNALRTYGRLSDGSMERKRTADRMTAGLSELLEALEEQSE